MYFENQKQYFLAGKFFLKSKQYAKVSRQLEGHVCVKINSFLPNNLCSISVRIKDNKVQYVLIKGHAFPQGLNKNFSNAKRTVFMETKLLLLFFFPYCLICVQWALCFWVSCCSMFDWIFIVSVNLCSWEGHCVEIIHLICIRSQTCQ